MMSTQEKEKIEYFKEFNGKLYAVMNCRSKPQKNDALIMYALTQRQLTVYKALRKEGKKDSEIFDILFPPMEHRESTSGSRKCIAVDPDMLNKKQLADLINKRIDTPLVSLQKMSKEDLKKLLLSLE